MRTNVDASVVRKLIPTFNLLTSYRLVVVSGCLRQSSSFLDATLNLWSHVVQQMSTHLKEFMLSLIT